MRGLYDQLSKVLRKKSNKSKLNRLRRVGDVRLDILEDRAALETVIDEIIALYDFRQGAVNAVLPFASDPIKREFHLALMETGILHASVYRVGERVAAALMGAADRGSVQNGVITYNPMLARHSPSKFHLLELARHLSITPGAHIDLTPGGDPWKDRFATRYDTVHVARLFKSRAAYGKSVLWQRLAPARRRARKALEKLRGDSPPAANNLVREIWGVTADSLPSGAPARRGEVADLLRLAENEATSHLAGALKNLERGEFVLLALQGSAWVREEQGVPVLHDVQVPHKDALAGMLRAAASALGADEVRLELDPGLAGAARALGLTPIPTDQN